MNSWDIFFIYKPFLYLAFIGILIGILSIVLDWISYKKSTYYEDKKLPYWRIKINKGNFGEYLTYKKLKSFEKDGAHFIFNCYLPKENNQTTEIDVIMFHTSYLKNAAH